VVDAIDELEQGRESYAARAWTDAHRSAYMLGLDYRPLLADPRSDSDS
jgi:hypothetical protein